MNTYLLCVFSSSFSFLDNVWNTGSAWSSKSTSATNQLGELKQVSNQSALLVSLPGRNGYRACVLLIGMRVKEKQQQQYIEIFLK